MPSDRQTVSGNYVDVLADANPTENLAAVGIRVDYTRTERKMTRKNLPIAFYLLLVFRERIGGRRARIPDVQSADGPHRQRAAPSRASGGSSIWKRAKPALNLTDDQVAETDSASWMRPRLASVEAREHENQEIGRSGKSTSARARIS